MWSLGGLSFVQLIRRTARESWDDDVFGQAARLAFYHFLALFPALLLILIPLARLSQTGQEMRDLLSGSFRLFLPGPAAALVTSAMNDLNASARAGGVLLAGAILSALWAGINASWTVIVGLNTAYEVKEDRGAMEIGKAAVALGFATIALVFAVLLSTDFLRRLGPDATPGFLATAAQWAAIVLVLLLSFALFYRFGPNLKRPEWQWSTPGAVFGVVLWIALTLSIRIYFDNFSSYQHIYGRLSATAMLMIWLYATSATILIGAELNSEIEKAAGTHPSETFRPTGRQRERSSRH